MKSRSLVSDYMSKTMLEDIALVFERMALAAIKDNKQSPDEYTEGKAFAFKLCAEHVRKNIQAKINIHKLILEP